VGEAQPAELDKFGENQANTLWQAMRFSEESGRQNLICWRELPDDDAVIEGTWQGTIGPHSKLLLLTIQVGERFWGMHETAEGPSYFTSDGTAEGPFHKQILASFDRAKRKYEGTHGKTVVIDWVCSRCHWPNSSGALCQMCHASTSAAAGLKRAQTVQGKLPAKVYSMFDKRPEYEGLPPGFDPTAKIEGELDLPPGLEGTIERLIHLSGAAGAVIKTMSRGKQEEPKRPCIKCRVELSGSAHFCTRCGADQRSAPPPGPESVVKPPMAASGSGWRCVRCGEANPQPARFCMNCAAPGPHAPPSPENPRKR
jgi:hypothetical protein